MLIVPTFLSVDTSDLDEVLKGGTTLKKSTSKKKIGSQRTLSVKGKLKDKKPKTSPDEREEALAAIGGRDTSLFLFRALGKILYCKSKNVLYEILLQVIKKVKTNIIHLGLKHCA